MVEKGQAASNDTPAKAAVGERWLLSYAQCMDLSRIMAASAASLLVAPIVGAYLCVSGVGLLRKGEASAFLADLSKSPGAMHGVGAIAFFAGATLLSLHRHWATPAELTINLVALLWVFEGAGLLANPNRLRMTLTDPKAATWLRRMQSINLPLGLYLLIVGTLGSPS